MFLFTHFSLSPFRTATAWHAPTRNQIEQHPWQPSCPTSSTFSSSATCMNEVHHFFSFLFFSFAWFSETRGGRVGADSVAHKKGVLGMLSLLLKVSFQVQWRLWTGQWGFWISVSLEGMQWCHSSVFPQMHSTNGGGRWISFFFPENDFSAFVAFQLHCYLWWRWCSDRLLWAELVTVLLQLPSQCCGKVSLFLLIFYVVVVDMVVLLLVIFSW